MGYILIVKVTEKAVAANATVFFLSGVLIETEARTILYFKPIDKFLDLTYDITVIYNTVINRGE